MRRIFAPEIISLYQKEYAIPTLLFIQQLYQYEEDVVMIDFSHTRHITAAAELTVLAHINYIQLFKQNVGCFQFSCKRSPVYHSLFIREGYLQRLKYMASKFRLGISFEDGELVKIGKVAQFSHQRAINLQDLAEFEQDIKAKVQKQNPLANLVPITAFFRSLKMGIGEVQLNIMHHAYEEKRSTSEKSEMGFDVYIEKPWWQMFYYSPQNRQLTFIICDLGLGITESYIKQATQERHQHYDGISDVFMEAISEGKSRFIGNGRGNGLSNVVKIAKETVGTSLAIFSGEIAFFVKNGKASSFSLEGSTITGTIVEWVFELPQWS
ncbi:hypothetical protein [Actinobacillus equuli]|uniref:hypothetical protein n=1 Tax=Actinobacillus equuli TaxID=718 RepID=UPI002441164D|nr:hypothetical protein [Actinobacillus equuli]WGE53761.1 hypothetical protein NYR69_04160 [Actinobacillus equuli subsp. haemolyticus]WGE74198.1 hypothetical protein NYR80_04150 [Actinobacillus equuli subsp. haemolyticus]